LLDPADVGRGLVFEYLNGGWCSSSGINRKLRVELQCPDSNRGYFDPTITNSVFETVVEDPNCIYTITYKCNCITKIGANLHSVCNGKGICASDTLVKQVRCLCDSGWEGTTCDQTHSDTQKISEDHTGIISAIVICIVLLAVALGISSWICFRIRAKEEEQKGHLGGEFFVPIIDSEKANTATNAEGLSMGQVNMNIGPSAPSPKDHDEHKVFHVAQDSIDTAESPN